MPSGLAESGRSLGYRTERARRRRARLVKGCGRPIRELYCAGSAGMFRWSIPPPGRVTTPIPFGHGQEPQRPAVASSYRSSDAEGGHRPVSAITCGQTAHQQPTQHAGSCPVPHKLGASDNARGRPYGASQNQLILGGGHSPKMRYVRGSGDATFPFDRTPIIGQPAMRARGGCWSATGGRTQLG